MGKSEDPKGYGNGKQAERKILKEKKKQTPTNPAHQGLTEGKPWVRM